jgi:hypothetical protein
LGSITSLERRISAFGAARLGGAVKTGAERGAAVVANLGAIAGGGGAVTVDAAAGTTVVASVLVGAGAVTIGAAVRSDVIALESESTPSTSAPSA